MTSDELSVLNWEALELDSWANETNMLELFARENADQDESDDE